MDQAVVAAFTVLRMQVGALQAQIDALAVLLETPGVPVEGPCEHRDTEDDPTSTLGHPKRRCLNPTCRAVIEG